MKIKHTYDILIIGMVNSWFLGLLILLLQSLRAGESSPIIIWLILFADILILFHKVELDKLENQSKLAWVEPFFLIGNLVTIVTALSIFLITFSPYWLAKQLRYFSLGLGLPSLLAIFYWKVYKNHKTIN